MAPSTTPSHTPVTRDHIVEECLTKALDIIQANALAVSRPDLFGQKLDIPTLTTHSRAEAARLLRCFPSKSGEEVAVELLTSIADAVNAVDKHTFFRSATPHTPSSTQRLAQPIPLPSARLYEDGIAALELPFFIGGDRDQWTRYVTTGQQELQRCAQHNPRALVIDLRLNEGGNMWPMFEVIDCLLGTDKPGGFHHPSLNPSDEPWSLPLDRRPLAPINHPVAVWTSNWTASSGEIISIMFRGRRDTRFFGDDTAGVPTANKPHVIEGIGTLYLTGSLCFDRTGKRYIKEIPPDERIRVPVPSREHPPLSPEFQKLLADNTNELLEATRRWLAREYPLS